MTAQRGGRAVRSGRLSGPSANYAGASRDGRTGAAETRRAQAPASGAWPRPIAPRRSASGTVRAENFARVSQPGFFGKLEEAQRWAACAEIETLIVNVATAAPTWLASIEAELDWRRVQAVTRRGDVQRGPLRASLRRRGRLAEASRALAFARDREAGGRTAAARSLTEIIVAEIPAFKPGWTFREERLARAPAPGAGSGRFR